MKKRNLIGMQFGRYSVVAEGTPSKNKTPRWACRCTCGNEKLVRTDTLLAGLAKSCGCLAAEETSKRTTTHGATRNGKISPTYSTWVGMKDRCTRPKHEAYPQYGGRGIAICDRWMTFELFRSDMGERPDGMELDRIDNDGNYEPGNCRWATPSTNMNNRRANRRISAFGNSKTLSEWSRATGLGNTTISERLRRGWDAEKALTTEPLQ